MHNIKTKSKLENELKKMIHKFLSEHLGEKATSISIALKSEMLTIFASKCLPPAEQNLTDKPMLFKLLQEVKTKQFDLQKSFLKAQIEKIMDCAVENIELLEKK